jgi:cytochrome c oxidase subunit 2
VPRVHVPRALKVTLSAASLMIMTAGCKVPTFGYPTHLASEQARRIEDFWKWASVAALAVGAFTLILILWAPIAYRRRGDSPPPQVRYNLPVEILYTVVPFVIVAGLFYYTVRDQRYLDKQQTPAQFTRNHGVVVDVTGFQWNWKFAYPGVKDAQGNDVTIVGNPQRQAELFLPAGRPVRFVLSAEDVIHSFWVPAFAYKRDAIPGRVSSFEITPDRPGSYIGRCAELCGVYHDRMNFTVTVLPGAAYDARMDTIRTSAAQEASK